MSEPLGTPGTNLDPELLSKILQKATPELSDGEIDVLIAHLRNERAQVLAAEAAGKAKPKSPMAEAAKPSILTVSLDDLMSSIT